MSYEPVPEYSPGDNQKTFEAIEQTSTPFSSIAAYRIGDKSSIPLDWHHGPHTLRLPKLEAILMWTWDILLTLTPACFFALILAAIRLDKQPISPYGEMVVNLTLLSPSVYPIIFAAVASRFFKNFARWRLEKRRGIELATLEQIFGSQSLASALERLLFVRTRIPLGIIIVMTWSLSPLGGQSAARLLRKDGSSQTGTVYYPRDAHQGLEIFDGDLNGPAAFYRPSLSSSQRQQGSATDPWDWPKIPKWPSGLQTYDTRVIDTDGLQSGNESYASMLGVQIQGLDILSEEAQYNFSVKTSYYDFNCSPPEVGVYMNKSKVAFPKAWKNLTQVFFSNDEIETFAAFISYPDLAYRNKSKPVLLNDLPSGYLVFSIINSISNINVSSEWKLTNFNCSMRPVVVETDLLCNSSTISTSCGATHQKRVNHRYTSQDMQYLGSLSELTYEAAIDYEDGIAYEDGIHRQWRKVEGSTYPSLTKEYLLDSIDDPDEQFTKFSREQFSSRMAIAFNTFISSALYYEYHLSSTYRSQPSWGRLNSNSGDMGHTEATITTPEALYRTNGKWVIILILTTECFAILAILGLILQSFIRGPDILGFASSLTRENPYMDLPPGGTALDGPARARALGKLRVHLADVASTEDTGVEYDENNPALRKGEYCFEVYLTEQDLHDHLGRRNGSRLHGVIPFHAACYELLHKAAAPQKIDLTLLYEVLTRSHPNEQSDPRYALSGRCESVSSLYYPHWFLPLKSVYVVASPSDPDCIGEIMEEVLDKVQKPKHKKDNKPPPNAHTRPSSHRQPPPNPPSGSSQRYQADQYQHHWESTYGSQQAALSASQEGTFYADREGAFYANEKGILHVTQQGTFYMNDQGVTYSPCDQGALHPSQPWAQYSTQEEPPYKKYRWAPYANHREGQHSNLEGSGPQRNKRGTPHQNTTPSNNSAPEEISDEAWDHIFTTQFAWIAEFLPSKEELDRRQIDRIALKKALLDLRGGRGEGDRKTLNGLRNRWRIWKLCTALLKKCSRRAEEREAVKAKQAAGPKVRTKEPAPPKQSQVQVSRENGLPPLVFSQTSTWMLKTKAVGMMDFFRKPMKGSKPLPCEPSSWKYDSIVNPSPMETLTIAARPTDLSNIVSLGVDDQMQRFEIQLDNNGRKTSHSIGPRSNTMKYLHFDKENQPEHIDSCYVTTMRKVPVGLRFVTNKHRQIIIGKPGADKLRYPPEGSLDQCLTGIFCQWSERDSPNSRLTALGVYYASTKA
ncbi:hypothetical protein F53441_111 [Fusarium austroafricanum]|uniref:Uncharacterized protein n=1 Tax=Fusarium austroafricanum TaxID=2364996 RepID=A0A8H4P5J0_9HYPO|nr:hypothetical protein F53441_111 [Fusarium austroafricanum]